ncbi:hypothetical protein GCM10010446_31360 [Streptomyces enissocaesilis]|uniref:Uncharacterized protein n=1 Tax=Streptomyces enissocaesilis TaxID=332589 RepID=A0ABN3X932_9ACTN
MVGLGSLPAHPCGAGWQPYHSADRNTADTGSSEVEFRLAGDGRALLIRSVASGDFLREGVRRHREPDDAAGRAVAELRAPAAELPGLVTLHDGCTDPEMDAWPVSVPAGIRAVLRETGGVRMAGLPELLLLPGTPEHTVGPEVHRMMGGDGTYWPVARVVYGRHTALAQIRVEPDTGEWGCRRAVSDRLGLPRSHAVVLVPARSGRSRRRALQALDHPRRLGLREVLRNVLVRLAGQGAQVAQLRTGGRLVTGHPLLDVLLRILFAHVRSPTRHPLPGSRPGQLLLRTAQRG